MLLIHFSNRLVKIGVKPTLADSALRDNGNNWVAALQSINQQLVIAIRADPYNTQLSMWGSRINVRISKSINCLFKCAY